MSGKNILGPDIKHFNIKLPAQLRTEFAAMCKAADVTPSAMVRLFMLECVAKHREGAA